MKHDFAQFRIDRKDLLFSGSLVRRFTAAVIDVVISGSIIISVGIPETNPTFGSSGNNLAGVINFFILMSLLLLPEILFRRSLGMWLMNLVVIPPMDKDARTSLLIRKLLNLLEFTLPSVVYFWMTALSKDYASLSDKASGCIVVREAILRGKVAPKGEVSKFSRVLIALVFSAISPILLIGITAGITAYGIGWSVLMEIITK